MEGLGVGGGYKGGRDLDGELMSGGGLAVV